MVKYANILTLILIAFICTGPAAQTAICAGDTPRDREKIADSLVELRQRVEKNPDDKASLAKIIEYVDGDWNFAKSHACGQLQRLGPVAADAVPSLIKALNCGDGPTEASAARALGAMGTVSKQAVPKLIAKLKVEDEGASWAAADALGEIGEAALEAIPTLERLTNSKNENMAASARGAVKRLKSIEKAAHRSNTTLPKAIQ
jgi:HEAT repeat protein